MTAHISAPAVTDLASCDSEQIQIPGAIQPHGVLIAADARDLCVSHVSANFEASTGILHRSIIGSLLTEVIGLEAMAEVRRALASESYAPANALTLRFPFEREHERNLVVHSHDDRIILEFEPAALSSQGHLVARVQAIMATLRETNSVTGLCEHAAQALRELTGYDRVMVYRFDAKGNGQVIAEDLRPDMEPYLNLRYPASDIPAQARRMFKSQRIRVIADVGYSPVPVLARSSDLDGRPLDMTFCGLRSVSAIHIEYLKNMGVGASLGISLVQDDQLWGLIICHHLTPRLVEVDVKAFCDLLGQLVMLLIDKASEREEIESFITRQTTLDVINQSIRRTASIGEGLAEATEALLGLVSSSGAAIRLNGQVRVFGDAPSVAEADEIMTALEGVADAEAVALESLGGSFPRFLRLASSASGVLFLPILNNPGDGVVWFRPELPRTVVWAGDPNKAAYVENGTDRLSPRKSFAAWRELLSGTSAPWTKADARAARNLRRVVTDGLLLHAEARLMRLSKDEEDERAEVMVKIDRAKSLFFANVSHEFRTPLTLMLAPLGDALNDESVASLLPPQRQRIEVAHRNSLRLLRLVNTLLDFSEIETGNETVTVQSTDLAALTAELAAGFRPAVDRAGMFLEIDCPPLGHSLYVDRDIWEKVVLNLLSNAFKFTFKGGITISLKTDGTHTELAIRDTGVGIPAHEMPRLFERFHRIEGQKSRSFEGSGIGLALVHDLVRLHGGSIEASSEQNKGTVFTVRIPFEAAHPLMEAS